VTEPDRIEAHAEVTTHEADGLALLGQQFRRESIEAILAPWLVQVQELEAAVWDCYGLGIDNSSGAALDQLGVVLGAARPTGLADDEYRWILRATVVALRSNGTGDDLVNAMRELMGGTSLAFYVTEYFPADVVVEPVSSTTLAASVIKSVLARVKAGGVGLQVVSVPSGDTFAFSTLSTRGISASARGLGDSTDALVGGQLVGVV